MNLARVRAMHGHSTARYYTPPSNKHFLIPIVEDTRQLAFVTCVAGL